jgi:hypothetical protein
MLRLIYPETRLISEASVISWALDLKIDQYVEAARIAGDISKDHEFAEISEIARSIIPPTLEEAIDLLEDAGKATFTRGNRGEN